VIQSFRQQVFDRYHFPAMIGFCLVLAVALSEAWQRRPPGAARCGAFAALLLALAAFDTAALHDHFRWQDVRWQLVRETIDSGVSPASIDAGFEVDGELLFDLVQAGKAAELCPDGRCRCTQGWSCLDDRYRVTLSELPGYRVSRSVRPDYWLVDGPPLLLLERSEP